MMKLLVITIDTEADFGPGWVAQSPESYQNIRQLERALLPTLERAQTPATLLLTGDLLERDAPSRQCEELRRQAGWELGTHLHGELVAPKRRYESISGVTLKDLQCAYPQELEKAKMLTLTQLFGDRFGFAPRSFRAGRYGAGPHTFQCCLRLGYAVDTSVLPGQIVREGSASADFRSFSPFPCVVAKLDGRALLEIPISLKPGLISGKWRKRAESHLRNAVPNGTPGAPKLPTIRRLLRPLVSPTWLRPSFASARKMMHVLAWLEAQVGSPAVVANMMFHSNELLAAASPYNATDYDVEQFIDRIGTTLAKARETGWRPVTLSHAATLLQETSLLTDCSAGMPVSE